MGRSESQRGRLHVLAEVMLCILLPVRLSTLLRCIPFPASMLVRLNHNREAELPFALHNLGRTCMSAMTDTDTGRSLQPSMICRVHLQPDSQLSLAAPMSRYDWRNDIWTGQAQEGAMRETQGNRVRLQRSTETLVRVREEKVG